jgi:hypothetical protein
MQATLLTATGLVTPPLVVANNTLSVEPVVPVISTTISTSVVGAPIAIV